MMKKFLFAAIALATVMPVAAQETYEVAEVSTQDLNGTARYVGMGGAMEALGADISTISTNPAAIGLSVVAMSQHRWVSLLRLMSRVGDLPKRLTSASIRLVSCSLTV